VQCRATAYVTPGDGDDFNYEAWHRIR
jgi:hypothetical protein